mgnify:CR=1 FL=1
MIGKSTTVILKCVGALLLLFLSFGVSFAQWGATAEKSAMRNIQKGRWPKAEWSLRKSLAKEPLNPSVRYTLSLYYFRPDNPNFHLDSAYHHVVRALEDYRLSAGRDREKLKRSGVDSLRLVGLRAKIDSAAFEEARKENTEAAYLDFLSHFPLALQRDLAAELRDEVAFQEALKENTYRAFSSYLKRYPDSKRSPEALVNYHRLLYFEETKDQRLASFEKFLTDYPETPYRREIYQRIFEISTADGSVESFLGFMTRYPVSDLVRKAGQMIFHILAEEDDPRWPGQFLNDSLNNLLFLNSVYLVPFLSNGKYGFMDKKGAEVIAPVYRSIHPDYLCGYITDEILLLDDGLFARNGSPVFRGAVSDFADLGSGFLKVNTSENVKVIHKGGFVLAEGVDDARVISKNFMALKKGQSWFIYTLTGKQLDPRPWADIAALGELMVFSEERQKFIVRKDQLVRSADALPLVLSEPFDEIKQWQQGLIWGRSGEFQGIINSELKRVIGFDRHVLSQSAFGIIAALPNGVAIYNAGGRRSSIFDQVKILGQRVAVRKNKSWFFLLPSLERMEGEAYDSVKAEGPFVLASREDSVSVFFGNNFTRSFYKPQAISFVPGMDSTSFLVVHASAQLNTVFDLRGKKMFTGSFDALEYAGSGIFVITKKGRKGLVNMQGETLLPFEFEAIGSVKEQVVSVLRNKKFGAYHVQTHRLVRPHFDRNLIPYASAGLVTFKGGYYGFLGWDNKPLSSFEFDEVRYWSDTLALVRMGTLWSLYDIHSRRVAESNLKIISFIRDDAEEKIAIVQNAEHFGVISNRGKIVIPITFSDVINLGSGEEPLYFTEKHIEEASLYIVIYYDGAGTMLRKEIYDDAGDYDRIYCSNQ